MSFHHREKPSEKQKSHHVNFRSITVQMFCCFLLLLVPLYVLGSLIISSSNDSMKQAVEVSAQTNADFIMKNFGEQVTAIDNQVEQLLFYQNSDIREFAVLSDQFTNSEYWIRLQNIVKDLKLIEYGNALTKNLELYFPGLNLFVSSSDGVHSLEQDNLESIMEACRGGLHQLLRDNDGLFVAECYPISSLSRGRMPEIILIARIDKSAMHDFFVTTSSKSQYPMALVDLNQQDVLLSTDGVPSDEDILLAVSGEYEDKNNRIIVQQSEELNLVFVQFIPMNILFANSIRTSHWLLVFILSCLPVVLAFGIMITNVVRKPIHQLLGGFHKVQEGDMSVRLHPIPKTAELGMLFLHFNTMAHKLDTLINQVYQQELYTKQIELKQLQAQIDPHFLYNSFFILKHLIKDEDMETASQLADYLSEYFKYITRNNIQEVMLKQEIHHGCLYLDIQKIRFGERLHIDIQPLPQKYETISVPRLIFQPVLENSVKYGSGSGSGEIRLSFRENDDMLAVCMEDNGRNLTDASLEEMCLSLAQKQPAGETTALINIHRRLQLRYGADSGIELSRSELGGLCVALKIPLSNEEGDKTNA